VNLTVERITVRHAELGVVVSNNATISGARARLTVRESRFDGGEPATMAIGVFAVTDVDAVIENNQVRRTTFSCLQPQGPNVNAEIVGNDLDECGPIGGIRAPGLVRNVVNIVRNVVRNSTGSDSRFGIRVSGGAGRIERNQVLQYVQPSADAAVAAGVSIEGGSTHAVRLNDIVGNAHAGLRAQTTLQLDATCNWWGAADGPSGPLGAGSGDAALGNAVVTPFATAPIATPGGRPACGM
jgi:hypothetical protein